MRSGLTGGAHGLTPGGLDGTADARPGKLAARGVAHVMQTALGLRTGMYIAVAVAHRQSSPASLLVCSPVGHRRPRRQDRQVRREAHSRTPRCMPGVTAAVTLSMPPVRRHHCQTKKSILVGAVAMLAYGALSAFLPYLGCMSSRVCAVLPSPFNLSPSTASCNLSNAGCRTQDHFMETKARLLQAQNDAVEEERRRGASRLASKEVRPNKSPHGRAWCCYTLYRIL